MSGLNITITGALFILTIATGVWLSHAGKPLNIILVTIHKLIAVATAVFIGILINGVIKNIKTDVLIIILFVVTGLSIIALFATGAFLSQGKQPVNVALLVIHNVATLLGVAGASILIYFLLKK